MGNDSSVTSQQKCAQELFCFVELCMCLVWTDLEPHCNGYSWFISSMSLRTLYRQYDPPLCGFTTHVRLPEGTLNTLNYPIDYCYVDYLSNLLINGVSDIMLPLFRVTLHQMHWEISKICRFVRPPTPLRHRKDEEKQLDELMFVTRRSYDPCCRFRWLLLLHFKVLYAHAERMGKPCSR